MNRTALSTGSTSSRRLPALLLVLLLCLVAQTTARPSSEDEGDLAIIPPDTDNVEIHTVKFVNGVMQKDHPVIMYKEDFVSEDYDPTKNGTSPGQHKKHKRRHNHRVEPQQENDGEQILFDILPDKPIVLEEDLKAPPVSTVEVTELAEPTKKEWLGKHPKKYHSRQRRQTYLNPYNIRYESVYQYYLPIPKTQEVKPLIYIQRTQVGGKKATLKGPPNRKDQQPTSIDGRGEFDLEHNSNPEDADYSIYSSTTTTTTRRPPPDELVPLAAFSPPGFAQPAARPPPPAVRRPSSRTDGFQFPEDLGYQANSNCQRASKVCCSQRNIGSQYDCFHQYGCNESISSIISTCS
ncbi:uncharacterized protein hdly isoform X3 [Drosophila takahashii]|uniref:uncharacterized protein hdly isoform X3 n=1 Tax=Drosophila takahashii TaxID=29030 RepID=UPI0007E6C1AC